MKSLIKNSIFLLLSLTYCTIFSQQDVIRIEGKAQGTTYHIAYFDKENRNLQPEIEKILKDFDMSVSTYKPNSIISRINKGERNVEVDQYFIDCFKKAKEVWKNTNGAFDPTVYSLVNAYGFGPGRKMKIEQKKIDSILQFTGFEKIKLKGKKVIKKDQRVGLDFNAFAQGYSVDIVSRFFDSKGITAYLVEIGGEVFAKGKKPDGNKWTVGIEKPIDNKETTNPLKAIAKLENMALATSGNYRRFIEENGVKYVHHIDPKTGYPTKNNLLSASIFSKECISSDAYATGVLVLGLEKARIFLIQHPELQAYLIYSDENGNYKTFETSEIKNIITEVNK